MENPASPPKTLFLHGLESTPHGNKYKTLVGAGYDVISPDMQGMDLLARVKCATQLIREHQPLIVGSSYGGITAVLASMAAQVELPGIVLCAPALERDEAPNDDLETLGCMAPTIIIHGTADEVIPVAVSQRFAARTGAELVEVDDDHFLRASHSEILAAVSRCLSGVYR